MEWYDYIIIAYAVIINIFAAAITVHDKSAAKKHRRRVPEKTLFITAAMSGCVVMYITMHIIHHKTKHNKFMLGIPVIFLAEVLAALGILIWSGAFSI